MANEAQDLAKVKERISALNSELGELYNKQNLLEQEIAKRKRELDMPVREKLIDEWIEQQPSKFDIKVNFSEYTKDYDIHVKRGDYGFEFSELFFVRESMSDSDVKCYLDEIAENLNLIDELVNQNVYNEQFGDEIFADKLAVRGAVKTGKFIRMQVIEHDMTLKDLCRACDMDYHQFSTTYRQRKIRPDWIVRIAHFFNVELEELILMDAK